MARTDYVENTTMQIGEVAKRTCLTVDAIRFYERRKLLPKADRTAGKFRLYKEDAVERLRFIQQMQGLGFSLKVARVQDGCLRASEEAAASKARRCAFKTR